MNERRHRPTVEGLLEPQPGAVITTTTPPGVGHGRKPPPIPTLATSSPYLLRASAPSARRASRVIEGGEVPFDAISRVEAHSCLPITLDFARFYEMCVILVQFLVPALDLVRLSRGAAQKCLK